MIRFSKKWLTVRTSKKLNKLSNYHTKERLLDYPKRLYKFFKSKNSFLLISLVVVVIYTLAVFDFSLYHIVTIKLKKDEAVSLLNGRLANIVTIFSISVTIFIFIINSIKEYRKGQDIFRMTLSETLFYPVLYYSISIIIINYFVSYVENSDTIILGLRFTDDIYVRFAVLFMWLCVFQALLIGRSFYLVYKAYDNEFIINKYYDLIEEQLQCLLKNELKERVSYNIYSDVTKQITSSIMGLTTYNKKVWQYVKPNVPEKVKLVDVNLRYLKKLLSLKTVKTTDISLPLRLNSTIYPESVIFNIADAGVVRKINKKFKRIFKIKKIKIEKDPLKELKDNLKKNTDEAINNNDEVSFKNSIELYEKIQISTIDILTEYNYEDKIDEYPVTDFFSGDIRVIGKDHLEIYHIFQKAFDKENKEMILEILSFLYRIHLKSLQNYSMILIDKYKYVFIWIYDYSKRNKELHKIIMEKIYIYLSEYVRIRLNYEIKENKDNAEKISRFYGRTFYIVSELLYKMLMTDDKNNFARLTGYFKNIVYTDYPSFQAFKDLEEKFTDNGGITNLPGRLYNIMLLGIESWVIQMYRISKLNIDEAKWYLSNIPVYDKKPINILNEAANIWSSIRDDYYNFSEWGNELEQIPLQVFTPTHSPGEWISFAGFINLINLDYPNANNIDDIPLIESLRYFDTRVDEICKELSGNYSKWNQLFLLNKSEEEYKQLIEKYRLNFKRLRERYDFENLKIIAGQELSLEKINLFKGNIYETWKPFTLINNLFKENVNIVNNKELVGISLEVFGMRFKMMFIDNGYQEIFGIERYGGNITVEEKSIFSNLIFKNNTNLKIYSNIIELLNNEIENRKNNKKEANMIFINDSVYRGFKDLVNSEDFQAYYQSSGGNRVIGFEGTYKGIPIYNLRNDIYKDKVIVCDFSKAFEVDVNYDDKWFDRILKVDVKEFTDDEIKKYLENIKERGYPESWMHNYKNEPLSDEDLNIYIKNSVNILIEEKVEFKIKDNLEYNIAVIKQSNISSSKS